MARSDKSAASSCPGISARRRFLAPADESHGNTSHAALGRGPDTIQTVKPICFGVLAYSGLLLQHYPVLDRWNRCRSWALLAGDTPDLSEDHGVRSAQLRGGSAVCAHPPFPYHFRNNAEGSTGLRSRFQCHYLHTTI
jgi:hypothetical protein